MDRIAVRLLKWGLQPCFFPSYECLSCSLSHDFVVRKANQLYSEAGPVVVSQQNSYIFKCSWSYHLCCHPIPQPPASPLWAAGLLCSTNVREKTFCSFNHSTRNSVMKSEMTSEFSRDQALRGFFTNPLLANPFSHIPGGKKIYIYNQIWI